MENVFEFYFTGDDLSGTLFNHQNLIAGKYKKFINRINFTYDSDYFNTALSSFLQKIDIAGQFAVYSVELKYCLAIRNDFDPLELNSIIEKENMVLKLVPTYIFDRNYKWAIYFHNDFDAFIAWCDNAVVPIFDRYFMETNEFFYHETDDEIFLSTISERTSYREEYNFEKEKKAICLQNRYLLIAKNYERATGSVFYGCDDYAVYDNSWASLVRRVS